MGIGSIKSIQNNSQITLNAVFTYQDMVKYKKNKKVSENYEFLEEIGSGAEGQVFKSRCKKTNNLRAIKKINKFSNPKAVQSISNQFNILKEIDHPCIVKIYELFEEDIFVYLVTELCEGKELFQLILEDKVIGEEKAFPIFYEALTTINFLHKNHIMHRDVKPENIIVNQETNSIKLIDLGTATKFDDNIPRKRKRVGTSYYIAPEVLRREYNQKCDIWSLGVILYILLSGSLPFKGNEDMQVIKAIEKGNVEFPPNKWKGISFSAKELTKRMLEKQSLKRPSAQQLLQSIWVNNNLLKARKQTCSQIKLKSINNHLNNMRKFKEINSNPIQEGIFVLIVNFIQDNKNGQKQFLETFRALDTNRDGVISLQELTLGLQNYLKLKRSECEIIAKKIFEKVDVNGSGSLDYTQFVMSASNVEIVVTQENIDLAFSFIDTDNSGKLTVQEIREKLGNSITQKRYNSLLRQFDKNNDGEISKFEFRDMMKALIKKPGTNCSERHFRTHSNVKNNGIPGKNPDSKMKKMPVSRSMRK